MAERDQGKERQLIPKVPQLFLGPHPWMIEAAVILSGVVKHWLDFFVILFLLFSNALVAFWRNIKRATKLPRCARSWRPRPAFCATENGRPRR